MDLPKATRFPESMTDDGFHDCPSDLRLGLHTIWTIEGTPGLWRYDCGVKADHVPPEPSIQTVAEANGTPARFLRLTGLEETLKQNTGEPQA
jgi:hypothetical protein